MRNKELIDKRFDQIDHKLKTLEFLLSRQSSTQDFKNTINETKELVENLKSMIEKETSPLRFG